MNYNSTPINVKAGNSLVIYTKSYQFLTSYSGIINTSVITCFDESTNEYVYTPNNVNNQITYTDENGKITLNIKILKNHIYTLTFIRSNTYSENKEYILRIKGV